MPSRDPVAPDRSADSPARAPSARGNRSVARYPSPFFYPELTGRPIYTVRCVQALAEAWLLCKMFNRLLHKFPRTQSRRAAETDGSAGLPRQTQEMNMRLPVRASCRLPQAREALLWVDQPLTTQRVAPASEIIERQRAGDGRVLLRSLQRHVFRFVTGSNSVAQFAYLEGTIESMAQELNNRIVRMVDISERVSNAA